MKKSMADPFPCPRVRPAVIERPEFPAGGWRAKWVVAVFLMLAAISLRLPGIFTDLWLDEIWSLRVARGLRSCGEVFAAVHHEINHHLNTLWIMAAGADASAPALRALPLTMGVLSIPVFAGLCAAAGRRAGWIGGCLCAGSYLHVLYSSELRGYAGVVLAALLTLLLLRRMPARPGAGRIAAFGAVQTAGLLCHLMFLSVMLASLAHASAVLRGRWSGWRDAARFLSPHAPGWVAAVVLYLVDVRFLVNGGGSAARSLVDSFGTALAWTLDAGGFGGNVTFIAFLATAFAAHAGWRRVAERDVPEAVFLAGVTLFFPVALVMYRSSDAVYPRHFLVSSVFLLLLVSVALDAWWSAGGLRRLLAAALLGGYGICGGFGLATFYRLGRGDSSGMVRYLAEHGSGDIVTVAGEQDLRVLETLRFHAPRIEGRRELRYFMQGQWPVEGAEFIVFSKETTESAEGREVIHAGPVSYRLEKVFAAAPLAGLHWLVYRRI